MARRLAPSQDTVGRTPANQPGIPMVKFGKRTMDDKPEYDAFLTATDNRPPKNDLYERINFLRTGRRTPNKPSSY
jgi:hypothetical protein